MAIKDKIGDDMKDAMRSKSAARLSALRMIRAELLNAEKEKGEPVTDERAIAILQKMVKQRRDSAAQFEQAGRAEQAQAELDEIVIIESYLPAGLSDAEIDAVISEILGPVTDKTQLGKAMGQIMGKLKATGRPFDGKAVNERVRARLGG